MTRDEFKRHLKASVHIGTGQTRKRDKQADSAEIERLTEQFLKSGGKIQELESEQRRPCRSPAFNPGDIGGDA
ncbi:hypothetical protein [Marinobacter nauticus]|uniref:hypothetical protein n=1 Tax=Marinobacter nauticus TaxID=2743 RepID=UPI001C99B7DD|nr:hypothetical protein [Marinobacter nauticus]MBY5961913.1 hypothetical protein [Marinobacter nauticus]